ncbi:MAG TPA: SDR family oxidoreductase [Steroidobacteraceae bacterium]|nr:SDR family oxidoreductase [Steroidobacteraceae bacterium]
MNRHQGKVAVVTGGSSGMGLATARRLLEEGARVAIVAREGAALERATSDLNGGERLLPIEADLSKLDEIQAALSRAHVNMGRMDILFANAGIGVFKPVDDFTEAEFDSQVALNFKGVFFTVQRALPLVNYGASIVLNASWTLHRALPSSTVYSATKAAVHNLARTLAVALAARHIRVNSVSPGFINTGQFNEAKLGVEGALRRKAHVPAGRFGTADEVATVVSFLASEEASYITGQDFVIDGGMVTALLP